MKLTERESKLVTLLVLVIIVAFGTRYLVLPAYDGWQSSKTALRQIQLADWQSSAGNAGGAEAETPPEYEFIPAASPESLHYYFSGLAGNNALELRSISISENKGALPSGFTRMDVSVSLVGAQTGIISFLTGFDGSGVAIATESAGLTPDGGRVVLEAVFHVYCEERGESLPFNTEPARASPPNGFRFVASSEVQ